MTYLKKNLEENHTIDPRYDEVNAPSHYYWIGKKLKNSVWEIQKVLSQGDIAIAEVIKYIARRKHKGNELQDLQKAAWYLIDRIYEIGGAEGLSPIMENIYHKK